MTWRADLIVFVLLVMIWTAGWWGGREAGLADGRAACADAQTRAYRDVLEQSAAQLKTVQDTSAALFQRLAKRADSDQQTTRELRHALAETAADRAGLPLSCWRHAAARNRPSTCRPGHYRRPWLNRARPQWR
ncbi:hypothetical protein [Pseudomonas aeruginosa]|uniref:hypothetical protein n=1 Tax=Pseudomonas aeruginosa TaxID=287 RepID=UPI001F3EDAC1|nr:hypothetical protein [Pseudomonas aeruginosa]